MNEPNRVAPCVAVLALVLLAATVTVVGASADPPASGPATRPTTAPSTRPVSTAVPAGLLAGPSVEATALTAPRKSDARARIPTRQWMRVYRELDLTSEQRRVMRVVMDEFTRVQRTFRAEHGAELDRLRAATKKGASGDETDREARVKMRALRDAAPKVVTYQRRLWKQLTTAQRREMREGLMVVRRRR